MARRNSVNKHALSPVSMDAADTGQQVRTSLGPEPCSLLWSVQSSLVSRFFLPPHIVSGKNGEIFFLCLLTCQRILWPLVCVRVLIPLQYTLPHSTFPCIRSFQFLTPVSFASCVLPHFFLLVCLWWDKFVSYSLVAPANQHTDQRWCYSVPDVCVSLGFRRDAQAYLYVYKM
jgi:hypothetical protein